MVSASRIIPLCFRGAWFGAAALAVVGAGVAHAGPIETLTFSGKLQGGWDQAGLFGKPRSSLAGDSYVVTFSYDPTTITHSRSSDGCGTTVSTSCYFFFTAATAPKETVTIAGHTDTFVGTAGGIEFTAGADDNVQVNVKGGNGLFFSGDFQAAKSFFPNPKNVNDPYLADFTNLALTFGKWEMSIGPMNFEASPMTLSADPPAAASEPLSVVLLGTGLIGLGVVRRRGAAAAG